MRFLFDMGVDIRVAKALAAQGHDVVHLSEQGLHLAADDFIFRKAWSENRILVTYDLGFNTIAYLTRKKRVSIVLFRLQKAKYDQLIQRLQIIVLNCGEVLSEGCLVVVDEKRHRVRRLPIGESQGEGPLTLQEPPAVYKVGKRGNKRAKKPSITRKTPPLRFTKPTAQEDKEIRSRYAEMKKGKSDVMHPIK
jgi:predicted nuclease of predicted toxin-antitoxin system